MKNLVIFPVIAIFCMISLAQGQVHGTQWIRVNQLGYSTKVPKVAVMCVTGIGSASGFEVIDSGSSKVVFRGKAGRNFGPYGPFTGTWRFDFSKVTKPGNYFIRCGNVTSPVFPITDAVYNGTADFALRYMRQQRSGYNPFLRDSCHTHDGYTIYGPMPDGTFVDVSGGWHDATDYLQYVATSANATYLLLAAHRDFPEVFDDLHLANGLDGENDQPDVLDEAAWGLEWLLKMHPRDEWMFNQLADDRDHAGFRMPNKDSVDYGYGKGKGRPVYFVSGKPQGLGKFQNRTTGASSTAGKFTSAFALGARAFAHNDSLVKLFRRRAVSAFEFGIKKPGVAQTAPNKARYFYEEDNWTDDMELAAAMLLQQTGEKKYEALALEYSTQEKITPWLGADTAVHYQWYPFINFGHYELAHQLSENDRATLIRYYKEGIEKVWLKARQNAFYRGVPFIWCSNNLTAAFAIQCYLYRKLSNDQTYLEMEQACFDWLFGTNPWGTSMVCGLPAHGDTPTDPHSSYTVLHKLPLDGGLVDGPVYGSIYNSLLGIRLADTDEYEQFQSNLAVYHDDYGDYSTNEPTMDGVAYLIYLLAMKDHESR